MGWKGSSGKEEGEVRGESRERENKGRSLRVGCKGNSGKEEGEMRGE